MERWLSRDGAVIEREGRALVEFGFACSPAGGGCAACAYRSTRQLPVALLGLRGAVRAGDAVTVHVDGAALDRIAAACFALPLVALLAGASAGAHLSAGLSAGTGLDVELVSGMAGLGSAAVMFAVVVFSMGGRSGGALLRSLKLEARLIKDR